jgi:sugar/nucleoside kinase (ribokinase family)
MNTDIPRYIVAGVLCRDFIILPSGRPLLDVPGGNALYAASGLAVWEPEPPVGITARVGEDFPQEWIEEFNRRGFDTRGIRILSEPIDQRSFSVYTSVNEHVSEDPVPHFSRLGLAFPKALLGFRPTRDKTDSRTRLKPVSVRQGDIPADYLDATAAHICPLDYLTHSMLPAVLRQAGITTVTLDPSAGYMTPLYWSELPALFAGLTAVLPSEEEIRALFHGRSTNLWEMAEGLTSWGPEIVVIKRGESGSLLYDSYTKNRWEVPAYPSKTVDPTGIGDAFCGGFLSGYRQTYDPLQACLHGAVSASLTIEGSGPFYAQEAIPGLAQARLTALAQSIQKV